MFKIDSPLMNFLFKAADFVILNILAVIISLPVFTIGAVKTSLLYGIDKILKDEEGSVVATFFIQFKDEFKRSSAIWLMYVFLGGITIMDIIIMKNYELGMFSNIMIAIFLAMFTIETIVVIASLGWTYKFKDNTKTTIKNGFFVALLKLPMFFIMALMEAAPVVLLFLVTESFPIVIFVYGIMGISIVNAIEVKILNHAFKSFVEKSENKE